MLDNFENNIEQVNTREVNNKVLFMFTMSFQVAAFAKRPDE